MSNSLEYSKEYNVHVYELSSNGILSIHSLFNYMQDIASEHATRLRFGKDDLLRENRFWVLSRLFSTIRRWPSWEEKLTLTTWPRGTDKLFALRDYELADSKGSSVASATSSWLVVDRTTRRVQRPDSMLNHITTDMPSRKATGRNADKIDPVGSGAEKGVPFRVKQTDLDLNLHVNHVNYIKWITDYYTPAFTRKKMPVEIEFNFLAEARLDEDLLPETSVCSDIPGTFNHSLFRAADNVEICRARIRWESYNL